MCLLVVYMIFKNQKSSKFSNIYPIMEYTKSNDILFLAISLLSL